MPEGGDVTIAAGSEAGQIAADANAAAKDSSNGGTGKRGSDNKKNEPCSCSKQPNDSNRNKANSTRTGKKARCVKCRKTGAQRAALKILELKSLEKAGKFVKPSSYEYWSTKGSKIAADHKVPADKIKQRPGFSQLEIENPEAARKVMTDPSNFQKLCAHCNRLKSNKGNFSTANIDALIQNYLKK